MSTERVWAAVKESYKNTVFLALNKLLTISLQSLGLETTDSTFLITMGLISVILFGSSGENLLLFST